MLVTPEDCAVQRAARQATLDHSVTQAAITSTINNYLSSVGLSNANVTYSIVTSNSVQTANIAATYSDAYTVPFIPTFHITYSLSASVHLRSWRLLTIPRRFISVEM
jgi:hypothetical protein